MEENKVPAKLDHRRLRAARTRANILQCCRRMMVNGNMRPDAVSVAQVAHCSLGTILLRFGTLTALYAEAVDDADTSGAILSLAIGEDWRIAGIPERLVKPIARAIVGAPDRK
jgi:hypothetical protein